MAESLLTTATGQTIKNEVSTREQLAAGQEFLPGSGYRVKGIGWAFRTAQCGLNVGIEIGEQQPTLGDNRTIDGCILYSMEC